MNMGFFKESEDDQKTVMRIQFNSGERVQIDIDQPDMPPQEACKGFIESKLLDNPIFYVNSTIVFTHKIEVIQFGRVDKRPSAMNFGV
jgi:hypothetical protein